MKLSLSSSSGSSNGEKLMIMNNQTELKKVENSQNHVLDKVSIS